MEGRRWREHQPGSSDPETQQNNKHQRSESARERMVHVCVCVCVRACAALPPLSLCRHERRGAACGDL